MGRSDLGRYNFGALKPDTNLSVGGPCLFLSTASADVLWQGFCRPIFTWLHGLLLMILLLILEIGINDLVVTGPEVVGSGIENLVRLGALRFSSIISTFCFLSSQRFFVRYIEFFLTRRKIFLCLGASTLTQRFSTIYIVVAGVLFFGHNACFKIVYHIPCIC